MNRIASKHCSSSGWFIGFGNFGIPERDQGKRCPRFGAENQPWRWDGLQCREHWMLKGTSFISKFLKYVPLQSFSSDCLRRLHIFGQNWWVGSMQVLKVHPEFCESWRSLNNDFVEVCTYYYAIMYIYIFIYLYLFIYIFLFIFIWLHMHINKYIYMYTYTCTCVINKLCIDIHVPVIHLCLYHMYVFFVEELSQTCLCLLSWFEAADIWEAWRSKVFSRSLWLQDEERDPCGTVRLGNCSTDRGPTFTWSLWRLRQVWISISTQKDIE